MDYTKYAQDAEADCDFKTALDFWRKTAFDKSLPEAKIKYATEQVERLEKFLSLQSQMFGMIGKRGGSKKSEAKRNASRENGKRGGRPKLKP